MLTMRHLKSSCITCPQCQRPTLRHRIMCPRCSASLPGIDSPPRKRGVAPDYRQAPQTPRLPVARAGMAFVYLISDGKYCKIGFAVDLDQRFSTLQHASARRLTLRAAVETSRPRDLERILHGLLAKKHVQREWFNSISREEWSDCVAKAPDYYI